MRSRLAPIVRYGKCGLAPVPSQRYLLLSPGPSPIPELTGGGGGRPPGLQWRLVIGSSMVNEQLSGCTAAPTGSLEPAVALELPLQATRLPAIVA